MEQNIGELKLFHGSPNQMEIGTLITPGYSIPEIGAQAFATTHLELATRYALGLPPIFGGTQTSVTDEKLLFNPIYVVVPKNTEALLNRPRLDPSIYSCSEGFYVLSIHCWVSSLNSLSIPSYILNKTNKEVFEFIKDNDLLRYKE
jgi:hypothetical protein